MDKYDFDKYEVRISDKGDRIVQAKDGSFHMMFRKSDGFTVKWGRTADEDPTHCPWGNEIADIEITTACSGVRDKDGNRAPCAFCFPPDTEITMADGSRKSIDEIKVGDNVLSYHNGLLVGNEVKEVYCRDYHGKLIGGFAECDNSKEYMTDYHVLPKATPEHPFMVKKGREYEEMMAKDLKYKSEAEFFFDNNKTGNLACLEEESYEGNVYNFHCVPDMMYFANGVLVHNCYKSNQPNGSYMSFDTFKVIFDKMNQPKTMTQIAFGVDAECKTNPDVWKIMDYCIENNVMPNVTVADIDQETAENIVKRCGACAVSCYERNKNCCYDSIKLLTDEAKRQGRDSFKVNMHLLVSHETEKFVFEVLDDRLNDDRLKNMGAIVLLSLKQKGRGKAFSKMDDEVYRKVIFFLQDNHISYGSDSCGANRLIESLKSYYDGKENGDVLYKRVLGCIEECEVFKFSCYVNVDGIFFPCSFMEGEDNWKDGIDLKNDKYKNFTTQVWNHPRVLEWRQQAMMCRDCNGKCKCPHYEI